MVSGLHREDKMALNGFHGFSFKKKTSRIDWRKIASVDLDRIVKEIDVNTLQDNIDHITFCNIESELETKLMDPNYVKLFKMSQYTIEYLTHCQAYLSETLILLENQLNHSATENKDLQKSNEKLQKELFEVKKENKKRKKMIETQQTLMSVTSSNYHQCAYCSKVFLNASYLQAHMSRRHSDVNPLSVNKQTSEIEKELERIRDRLRQTENDLAMERNNRLNVIALNSQAPVQQQSNDAVTTQLLKQMEELKNNEIKRLKEELKRTKESLRKEINELNERNSKNESIIKDLQEKLGKQSHVGWMKDDIDIQKDTVLKQNKEIERLKALIENYEKQIKELEDQKQKLKARETSLKQKHAKEIQQKDEIIANLNARIAEMQDSVGKSNKELIAKLDRLQAELQQEQQLRYRLEEELAELKNRPPPITPRQPAPAPSHNVPKQEEPLKKQPPSIQPSRSPSPTKSRHANPGPTEEIYLPEYCPLTLKLVQTNPTHLQKFKQIALTLFEKDLDEIGISLNDTGLSNNDYKQKMSELLRIRRDKTDDLASFNEYRQIFSELADKFAGNKLNSSLRSSVGNRVKFRPDVIDKSNSKHDISRNSNVNDSYTETNQTTTNNRAPATSSARDSYTNNEESEETDDDVSLSNALESDEEDTEPTKSIVTDQKYISKQPSRENSPRKGPKVSGSMNPEDVSELESVSQAVSEKSASRKKGISEKGSSISDKRKMLEKQFEQNARKGVKPSPSAVPVGFQPSSRTKSKDEDSFSSVSDIDIDEPRNPRPRSGLRSSLQDSNSSSIWVSESQSIDQPNPANPPHREYERPPTANSLKTSNFDSDEVDN